MISNEKKRLHERFWQGEGPSLILLPPADVDLYDTVQYRGLFYNPRQMWESEMRRARAVVDWPTDGVATVRPNLGTIFVPATAGQEYVVRDGQMPWAGPPLSDEALRKAADSEMDACEVVRLADEFYQIHLDSRQTQIAAYQADTQGVFDVAHMLCGEALLYDLADPQRTQWVEEALGLCLDLTVRAAWHLKRMLGEHDTEMVHGHGTPQGVYFPHAGIRLAEDSAILLSPASIERFVVPVIERSAALFGGAFVHFCGLHRPLLERLCRMHLVRAIDLGNPELYDPQWVMECCAAGGTVLYSRLAGLDGEDWRAYTRRLAELARRTGERCILRATVFPTNKQEAADMQNMWHDLTA